RRRRRLGQRGRWKRCGSQLELRQHSLRLGQRRSSRSAQSIRSRGQDRQSAISKAAVAKAAVAKATVAKAAVGKAAVAKTAVAKAAIAVASVGVASESAGGQGQKKAKNLLQPWCKGRAEEQTAERNRILPL
ncbi:unnamed protein product, partial [Ixodes persulcatus]